MLYLAGHDGLVDAGAMEGLDQSRELTQRHPVHFGGPALRVCRGVLLDFRRGLFFDGGHDYVIAASARRIQHQEREAAIAGNQSQTFCHGNRHASVAAELRNDAAALDTASRAT